MHTSSPWDLMLPLSQLVKKSSQSAEAKKMMLKHFAERMPLNHMFYALHHFKSISAINNCLSHLSLNLWLTVFTFSINREFFFFREDYLRTKNFIHIWYKKLFNPTTAKQPFHDPLHECFDVVCEAFPFSPSIPLFFQRFFSLNGF